MTSIIKTKSFNATLFSVILLCGFASNSQAEVLQLDGMKGKVVVNGDTPQRGMHKKSVLKKFGQPSKRADTVGKPPITTWHYPGYSVYFENHHVIHTVKH